MSSSAFAAKVAKVSDEANRSYHEDTDGFKPPVGEYFAKAVPDENGDRLQIELWTPKKGNKTNSEYPIITLTLEIFSENGGQGMTGKKVKSKVYLNPDDNGKNRGAETVQALLRSAKVPIGTLEESLISLNEVLMTHAVQCETRAGSKGEFFNLKALVPMN